MLPVISPDSFKKSAGEIKSTDMFFLPEVEIRSNILWLFFLEALIIIL
jgi:hypothetical protein